MSKVLENQQPLKEIGMEAKPPQVTALHNLDEEAHIDCPYSEKRTTTRVARTRSVATKYVHNLHWVLDNHRHKNDCNI